MHPAPEEVTFEAFFKNWFIDDYMPRFGKHYRDYLKKKASRESFLKSVNTTVNRWFQKVSLLNRSF